MFQLKIILSPPSHHIQRKVKCNNSQYSISLPLQNYRFIDILQDIVFQPQQQLLISVLGQKRSQLGSFEEFYKVQQDSIRYFNQKVNFDFNDLVFKFLSQAEKVLIQLDKCKFVDLMAVIHKAYDTYSGKLYGKFTRRIKKYLSESSRIQSQKLQIKKIIELIKSDSTDQEPQFLQKEKNKKEQKKPIQKEDRKESKKEIIKKEVKKEVKQEEKKQEIKKIELPKQEQKKQQDSNNENQNKQEKQVKSKVKNIEPQNRQSNKYQEKHRGNHNHNHNHDNNNQEDWQDVRQQKINKRKQKNNRRKHQKFGQEQIKKEINPLNAQEEDDNDDVQERKITKSKPNRNENNDKVSENKKLFEKTRQKPKKDLRIFLGLNGDSDDGWRQRYRVDRVPARISEAIEQKNIRWKAKEEGNSKPVYQRKDKTSFQKKEKLQKQPKQSTEQKQQKQSKQLKKEQIKQQAKQKKQENPSIQPIAKIVKIPSQGNLVKIFSYPKDGKKFILNPSSEYKIRVNNNFWIIIEKNQLKIEKDKSGYIRSQKFQSNVDYFIEAQDLTIAFDGLCNLEDGGTPFGQPKIENFTGSNNQWFHLKELDVYAFA